MYIKESNVPGGMRTHALLYKRFKAKDSNQSATDSEEALSNQHEMYIYIGMN